MIEKLIGVACGEEKAELLLTNVQVANTISGEIYRADVAIHSGLIVGVGDGYEGEEVHDLGGKFLVPGFIDGHVHIESSMLSVGEFARAVVPQGTTTVVVDPHEIANVCGLNGISYMLKTSNDIPLNVFMMLPSCVPATHMETSGAKLEAYDLKAFQHHPRVLGLGEFMNFPGILLRDPEAMEKVELFRGRTIDGHAPGLTRRELGAYILAGITSDHECTTVTEAQEKLRVGMYIMLREGSVAHNLDDLIPLVNKFNDWRCLLATDDRHPQDLVEAGHIGGMVRRVVREQGNVIRALRVASLNTARYYGLKHLGAIAPGYTADLLVVDNFIDLTVERVYKDGKMVAEGGKALFELPPVDHSTVLATMNLDPVAPGMLPIPVPDSTGTASVKTRIIGMIPGQLVTSQVIEEAPVKDGFVITDTSRDILKLAVVERHRRTGNIGRALVRGFGLKTGALASSVGHDSHNITVVGVTDEEMALAVNTVARAGGGLAAVRGDTILAQLELPIAGLMSTLTLDQTVADLKNLHQVVARELGCPLEDPFTALSFLSLPVIPELKLTDKGLVDVGKFDFVDLFV